MEEMMAELEAELASAKQGMVTLKKSMKSQLSTLPTPPPSQVAPDAIIRGPKHGFTKASRFKNDELPDSTFGVSVLSEAAPQEYLRPDAYQAIQMRKPAATISKTSRFVESKVEDTISYEPNYNLVKRGAQSHVIAPLKSSAQKPSTKLLLQSGLTQSELDELETQDSMSQVGPGAYDVRYDQIDVKKSSAFTKGSRFQPPKQQEGGDINPNFEQVRMKAPTARIARESERTKQLKERDELAKEGEVERLQQYQQRALVMDVATRVTVPGVVMMKSYKEIVAAGGDTRQRRYLIMKLMDEMKYASLGPGAYSTHAGTPAPCMVVLMRPHSAEGRHRIANLERPTPGPDYYYSKDDLCRTQAVQHEFGRAERLKKPTRDELDMRRPLDIRDELVHVQAPQQSIAPEQSHFSRQPNQDAMMQEHRGPAKYDTSTQVVLPRTDKGAVTLHALNAHNDRVEGLDPVGREREFHDYVDLLVPSLDAIKPHAPTFGYHEATQHQPQHVPDKMLFPEVWQHYDPNLNVVREEVGTTVPHFGGRVGRGLVEFLRYQEHLDDFKAFQKRRDNQPEQGQYDINYRRLDADPKAPNFNRYVESDHQPIEKVEGFVAGDNLLLQVRVPEAHLANFDFGKLVERPPGPQVKEGPELLLEPNYAQVKPRVKLVPNFEKQLERPPSPKMADVELLLQPQPVQPRVKGHINFEKQVDREEDPRYVQKVDDRPLVVEPNQPQKQTCLVKINNGVPRFPLQNQPRDDTPAPVNLSRVERAEKAIRANIPAINIKATSTRKSSVPTKPKPK